MIPDTSILHHAYMLIFIALWAVIICFVTILMPFLSYFTRFTRRGRMPAAGILGWKRSKLWKPILHNSKSPETPQNIVSENIKNIWRKKPTGGATGWPRGWGRARLPRGPAGRPAVPIFSYMKRFDLEKNQEEAFGNRRRRLEAEPRRKPI